MEFKDLQAIWDTQNERPVFAINDSRLSVALYQQREHRRRRLFNLFFIPFYGVTLAIVVANALLFLLFFAKTIYQLRPSDPPMTVWDGAALLAVITAAVDIAVRLQAQRGRHQRAQKAFAPSLREELEHGISQLDFELSLLGTAPVRKMIGLVSIGTMVFVWEVARLNGLPAPWLELSYCLFVLPAVWANAAAQKAASEEVLQRKRALESMRATLVD